MDFVAEDNNCGQTILRLVARGNSIIAELKRLASAIPNIFRLDGKGEIQKYGDIMIDFSYFQSPEVFSKKIENSKILSQLDNNIRDQHLTVICRIYAVFESIHRYATHLNNFLKEVKDGSFLHISTETVFADNEGKQLMCEGLYLYGVMLLLVDHLYPGSVRERLIVAHHRHAGLAERPTTDTNIDDVCRLLRSTGFKINLKKPIGYPEDYFKRIELPKDFIEQVLGHLRTDDVYNQVSVYPLPEHRAVAFSTQATMLFVCLYFSSQTLHINTHRMREIVDRFFPDNWVISYFMGTTVNLIDAWDPYKAAKQALTNTIESSNIKQIAASYGNKLGSLTSQSSQLESEGVLNETKVLSHSSTLFKLLRECNVTLRWLMLHCAPLEVTGGVSNKRCKIVRDQVISEVKYSADAIFDLLLHTAGLEFKVSQIYKKILHEKNARWQQHLDSASSTLLELSEAFTFSDSGVTRPLARVKPNAGLQKWFSGLAEQLMTLLSSEETIDSQATARKLVLMIQALNEVKEYHDLSSCGGAVQAVEEITSSLQSLVRLTSAEDRDTTVLALVADLSYAWVLIDQYTAIMQRRIKQEPAEVSRLRAVFLKQSTGLELPLLRITQAQSQDVLSVSAFYSGKLVSYIRKVLQIIPETMFSLVGDIVNLHTHHLKDLPSKLEKDKLKDLAQLPQRYKVSELCHSVGVLAEGVSEMGDTLVGVEKLQPKQLLEEGVRRELVNRVTRIMHQNIVFTGKKGTGSTELMNKMSKLSKLLKGFRSSFEYIQDYINLYALKIWHEELTRIIRANVLEECASLLPPSSSSFASPSPLPVPSFPSTDAQSINFLGRLANEITRITDPKTSTYVWLQAAWYDNTKHRAELVDSRLLFSKIEDTITIGGLAGLDRLFACKTIVSIKECNEILTFSCDTPTRDLIHSFASQSTPNTNIIMEPAKHYTSWLSRFSKLSSPGLIDTIQKIGQLQLLRLHASFRLQASSSFQANYLHEAIMTLNISLLHDVKNHAANPDTTKYPDPLVNNPLTTQLTDLLEYTGVDKPIDRMYLKPSNLITFVLPYVIFFTTMTILPKLYYCQKLGSIISVKINEGIDGSAYNVGVVTLLRQTDDTVVNKCLSLFGQYVASQLHNASKSATTSDISSSAPEILTITAIVRQWADLLKIKDIKKYLPGDAISANTL